MTKLANHLREHISGEVFDSEYVRDWFATDGSIFKLRPKLVIYPRRTSDVAKLNRFLWKLNEKGARLSLTSRGAGSDQSGAAIGDGIILAFSAHMNKILELDTSRNYVDIQPGIIYAGLEQTLYTHGKFLPPYPSSVDFATLGGSIANNAAGEKSVKYGSIKNYVQKLKVVLANGDVIETERLSKAKLNKKKALNTFEGEIYRQVDHLTDTNKRLLGMLKNVRVSKNSSGYNLADVKDSKGNFDLTPLFVGSQGTLGVITEARLKLENYNPDTSLIVAEFADINDALRASTKLNRFKPSALEIVDGNLIDFVKEHQPGQIDGLLQNQQTPAIVLLCEFDDKKSQQKIKLKKSLKVLDEYTKFVKVSHDGVEQEELWKLRHSAATVLAHRPEGGTAALPIIEDACVPAAKLPDLIKLIYGIFQKNRIRVAIWGHAGDANLHVEPFLNLTNPTDRRRVFKIVDEYYREVIKLGGTISGEHNDGRIRAPYLRLQYGDDIYELFVKLKAIFDPLNIMNPGVKIGVNQADTIGMMRGEFSIDRYMAHHLPKA
jgi:FAD/FMN-containing dehydrogenase